MSGNLESQNSNYYNRASVTNIPVMGIGNGESDFSFEQEERIQNSQCTYEKCGGLDI